MTLTRNSFLFVRHGETYCNRSRTIAGSRDVVLTPRGREQAIMSGRWLEGWQGEAVASSSHLRARQTARLAMPNHPVMLFDGLRERCWGPLERGPVLASMPYIDAPDGVEPWDEFVQRVEIVLNRLLSDYDHPLVFAHSGVFRAIRTLVHGSHLGPSVPNARPISVRAPASSAGEWQFEAASEPE